MLNLSDIMISIQVPMVTTESGLQYKDIKVGEGPSPPVGFQVADQVIVMFSNMPFYFLKFALFTSHILLHDSTLSHVGCSKLCCYGANWADIRQVGFG
jgi:hypothetical protein